MARYCSFRVGASAYHQPQGNQIQGVSMPSCSHHVDSSRASARSAQLKLPSTSATRPIARRSALTQRYWLIDAGTVWFTAFHTYRNRHYLFLIFVRERKSCIFGPRYCCFGASRRTGKGAVRLVSGNQFCRTHAVIISQTL